MQHEITKHKPLLNAIPVGHGMPAYGKYAEKFLRYALLC